jgi:hypothetical protein
MLLYGTLFTVLSENVVASAIKCIEIERTYFYDLNRCTGLQHQPGELSRYSDHPTSWAIWGSNSGGGNRFFCSPERPDRLCNPITLLFGGYRGSFLRLGRPGLNVDHSM